MGTVAHYLEVNASAETCYAWWRGLTNLPQILPDVESVQPLQGSTQLTHWTVSGIPPTVRKFAPGKAPTRSTQGENSFGDDRYGGPCPPKGDAAHHYEFNLYALRKDPKLPDGAKPDDVRAAIKKQALARGRLIGTFRRG